MFEQVRKQPADLILLPVELKLDTGTPDELYKNIAGAEVPLLFYAKKADESLLHLLKQTGAAGYILQHYSADELKTAIEFAIDKFDSEKELRNTAKKHQLLIAEASDILWVTDLKTLKTTFSSPAIEKILGYTPAEDMALPMEKKFTSQSFALIQKALAEELAREQEKGVELNRSRTLELQQYHKNGTPVWTEVHARFLRDADNKAIGLIGVSRDISERKTSENELKKSEQRFKDFARIASDYYWELDADLRYSYISEHYHELVGKDPELLLGKTRQELYLDLIHEEKQQWMHLFNLLDSHKPFKNFIYTFIRPDGEKRILLNHGMPLFDEQGRFAGYRGVESDITKFHNAQVALKEKTMMLDNIMRSATDFGIATTDLDFHITYINPIAEEIFGYKAEEILGKTVKELHAKENVSNAAFLTAIKHVHERGVHKYAYERETALGLRNFESRLSGIYNPQEEITGYSLFISDVTERKNAEKIMLKASRMEATATLAAGIAHDFNNLMVGVLGNADLLKMRFHPEPETMDMLDSIAASASQAGELAQQLLSFARGGKYQPRNLDLNDMLRQVFKRDKHIFPPRIRLETRFTSKLWQVFADPTQMSQVIMNLCLNAVESIEKNGIVSVTTRNIDIGEAELAVQPSLKPGNHVQLSVNDNGKGMDKPTMIRIFEPFFSTKFQGRGLGLAAVYGIIKNHDGCIFVDSAPGEGSRFTLYFPATTSLPEKRAGQISQLPYGVETILLIDDESLILDVSARILQRFGYQVIFAKNGREAVQIAENSFDPIHLAILDMGMPVLSGAEAFPLLLKARPKMKVIICSGYELDKAARAMLDNGAVSFLQKPFQAEDLVKHVRQALDGQV